MDKEIKKLMTYIKKQGAEFAEVRVVDSLTEKISSENSSISGLEGARSKGVGIRVFIDGVSGFCSTRDIGNIRMAAMNALEAAAALEKAGAEKTRLLPKPSIVGKYSTPVSIDPFSVSIKDKIALIMGAQSKMREVAGISTTKFVMKFVQQNKLYYDTEGSRIEQKIIRSGGGMSAVADTYGDSQRRSYPDSFAGTYTGAGYEFIEKLDFQGNARRIAEEAAMLSKAQNCPSGIFDIILDGSQMALQLHESIGHPVELDRILGYEAATSGKSFITEGMLDGSFAYGSSQINVVADGIQPDGIGTYGFDDEGIMAQKTVIIDKGILKNAISSRGTASSLNRRSNGCSHADGWSNLPLVRMTNINLMPGDYELAGLIQGVENGLYFCTNKSWSIDDLRINFQFGCEMAYEIKGGKLTGKIFKNPVYSGLTTEFWKSCDGVGNEKHWLPYGVPDCLKGNPFQTMGVGHGTSPARFRRVKVGI